MLILNRGSSSCTINSASRQVASWRFRIWSCLADPYVSTFSTLWLHSVLGNLQPYLHHPSYRCATVLMHSIWTCPALINMNAPICIVFRYVLLVIVQATFPPQRHLPGVAATNGTTTARRGSPVLIGVVCWPASLINLPATCRLLLATCHKSYVTCHMPHATCHMTHTPCHMTHDTWHMTHDAWHMAHDICNMTHGTCNMSHTTCHMPDVTCHMPHATCHVPQDIATCHCFTCLISYAICNMPLAHVTSNIPPISTSVNLSEHMSPSIHLCVLLSNDVYFCPSVNPSQALSICVKLW